MKFKRFLKAHLLNLDDLKIRDKLQRKVRSITSIQKWNIKKKIEYKAIWCFIYLFPAVCSKRFILHQF